jgi:hypothetical protein
MLNRITALIGIFVLAGTSMTGAAPTVRTIEKTVACPTEEDFHGYLALLVTDVSAATAYALDHHCIGIEPETIVTVDKGSTAALTDHVCIRPASSTGCFWTFAAHIKVEGVQ